MRDRSWSEQHLGAQRATESLTRRARAPRASYLRDGASIARAFAAGELAHIAPEARVFEPDRRYADNTRLHLSAHNEVPYAPRQNPRRKSFNNRRTDDDAPSATATEPVGGLDLRPLPTRFHRPRHVLPARLDPPFLSRLRPK